MFQSSPRMIQSWLKETSPSTEMQTPAPAEAACGGRGLMGRSTFLITSPITSVSVRKGSGRHKYTLHTFTLDAAWCSMRFESETEQRSNCSYTTTKQTGLCLLLTVVGNSLLRAVHFASRHNMTDKKTQLYNWNSSQQKVQSNTVRIHKTNKLETVASLLRSAFYDKTII